MRLIDADALLDFLQIIPIDLGYREIEDVENFVKELPTIEAEPERKKGRWIDMGDFEQCSVCKGTHLKEVNTVYGKAIWIKSAYCQNCGADMRGEENETD